MSDAIRLVLADDHALVLEGLRAVLDAEPDMEVVATADSGEGFLTAARLHRPDVAVLDLGMPDIDGLRCLERLRELALPTRVLVLSGVGDSPTVRAALERGAAGYALKTDPARHTVAAVRQVHLGHLVLPGTARGLLFGEADADRTFAGLTDRERAVLAALGDGLPNTRIAEHLGVSVNTVKFHLQNVFLKLGVANRTEAAARFHRVSAAAPRPHAGG